MKIQTINAYQAQKSKAESCNKPSFKGTAQASVRIGTKADADKLLSGVKVFFSMHYTTARTEGIDTEKGINYVKASFPERKDKTILKALANFIETLTDEVHFSYTTEHHSLTKEELERIDLTPTWKKPAEPKSEGHYMNLKWNS